MRVCVFGSYRDDDLYMRNRVLVDLLQRPGVEVTVVRSRVTARQSNHARFSSVAGGFRYVFDQLRSFASLARRRRELRVADAYFIPYPAYFDILFLRVLLLGLGRKAVVVDAFLCLHDTVVFDRNLISPDSLFAKLIAGFEKHTLGWADRILIDTPQQASQLLRRLDFPREKVVPVPVGIDESMWTPLPQARDNTDFTVLFWGTFIPLHGVEWIARAGAILKQIAPQIRIRVIGDGQTGGDFAALVHELELENVSWLRQLVTTDVLRAEMAGAHCMLGVFGDSLKAGSVVPYKVQQALASNRVVITRAGPAMAALSSESNGLITVPPADEKALAAAIVSAQELIRSGATISTRSVYDHHFSNELVGAKLAAAFDDARN